MSYESKIETARNLITAHNNGLPEGATRVDADAFVKALQALGGTTEEAIADCSWEDLQNCGLPKLVAKRVAAAFRSTPAQEKPRVVTEHRAKAMSIQELVAYYDPRNADNAVGAELARKSKGGRCVVFSADESVDVVATVKLVNELHDGFPERPFYKDGNGARKTYKVGERPDQEADENPLFPGSMLRPDGTCDQTNRSWEGVPREVRVLLYLAVHHTGECRVSCLDEANDAMDKALVENAAAGIRARYPRAELRYTELGKQNQLPRLKIDRSGSAGRVNNPFGQNRVR